MQKAIKFFKTTFLTLCLSTSLLAGNCAVAFAVEENAAGTAAVPDNGITSTLESNSTSDTDDGNDNSDSTTKPIEGNNDSDLNDGTDDSTNNPDTDSPDSGSNDGTDDSTNNPDTNSQDSGSTEDNSKETNSNAKIHFLTLKGNTLAVLLECNGHFGLVDAGEDGDYPKGDNPIYPFRDGTVTDPSQAFENQVVEYLHSVGVTTENFDFFIGTHAHSDHLGGADTVIREFHPKRVYTPEYHDAYLQYNWRMFDNLYIYDQMLEAADEVGSTIILNFDPDAPVDPAEEIDMPQLFNNNSDYAPAQNGKYENISKERNTVGCPDFTLGDDMQIHIKNYKDNSKDVPLYDVNEMSLAVLVEANGKTAYITGDIEAYNGDEDRLINEVPPVDIMTVSHHGWSGNSYDYIQHLQPDVMVLPGNFTHIKSSYDSYSSHSIYETLHEQIENGALLYPTAEYGNYTPALVFNFDEELTNTIPTGIQYVGKFLESDTYLSYKDGRPYPFTGDLYCIDRYIHFENNYMSGDGVFIKENNKWRFLLSDGTYAKDRYVNQNSDIYYIDHFGYMIKGWKKDVDQETRKTIWYYFDNSGAMVHGWDQINGTWYYFDKTTGQMCTGAQAIDGEVYCFTNSGAMIKNGWSSFDNQWYYLSSSGAAVKGWLLDGGYWYYLNKSDGAMAKGLTLIDGKYYYFSSSGVMQTGWQLINGSWYYLNSSGAMQTDWLHLDSTWYYLDSSGVMQTGWQLINNYWYYLNSSGVMLTGWQLINGSWYYLNGSGAMQTGWLYSGRKWYYLDSSGAMKTGWQFIDDYWYYLDGSGAMKTGWIHSGKTWYYLNSSGRMLTNTTVNGYTLDENGAMI